MARYCAIIISLAVCLSGCADKELPRREVDSPEAGVVEYMIGGPQIKQYQDTESKLKGVDKTLKDRFEGF